MILKIVTAGESHGQENLVIIENFPSGLKLNPELIKSELTRRRLAPGRSCRQQSETDWFEITAGLNSRGETSGAPLALKIVNQLRDQGPTALNSDSSIRTVPRPNHAELCGLARYNTLDASEIAERASGRRTVADVLAGAVCRQLLCLFGVNFNTRVIQVGCLINDDNLLGDNKFNFDYEAENLINSTAAAGDSLGGALTMEISGLAVGLGDNYQDSSRLDYCLGGTLLAIPSIKGLEFGGGRKLSALTGSAAVDRLLIDSDSGLIRRGSNLMGGLEGGFTTGEPLVVTLWFKPVPTFAVEQSSSVDVVSRKSSIPPSLRADVFIGYGLIPIVEARAAIILADCYLDLLGRVSVSELKDRLAEYNNRLKHSPGV